MVNRLPMRQGVGVIVLNQNNKVFVGKRKDNPIDKWQMPQGGINLNETPFNAMKRELEEETSITKIEVLKEKVNALSGDHSHTKILVNDKLFHSFQIK